MNFNPQTSPNQTINNNINIINNITQINCRPSAINHQFFSQNTSNDEGGIGSNFALSGGALSSNSSFDNEIINNLSKKGTSGMTVEGIRK